jgi:polyisoprenoid-binding protein YceI
MTTTTMRYVNTMAVALMTSLAACVSSADARPDRDTGTARDAAISATSTATLPAPAVDSALPKGAVRFTVASTGNAARYRVREQLMGHDLPNDAVGETPKVTGVIVVDSTGAIVAGQSRFVVDVTGLKSDSDRRDGYVRRRLLETEKYQTVELVPTTLRGLPAKLSASTGSTSPVTFDLIGNLTVHGVTHPTTWRVTARQANGRITGKASTRFTFSQFDLTQPRVPVVLSVADTIGLEYDFTLTRDAGR